MDGEQPAALGRTDYIATRHRRQARERGLHVDRDAPAARLLPPARLGDLERERFFDKVRTEARRYPPPLSLSYVTEIYCYRRSG